MSALRVEILGLYRDLKPEAVTTSNDPSGFWEMGDDNQLAGIGVLLYKRLARGPRLRRINAKHPEIHRLAPVHRVISGAALYRRQGRGTWHRSDLRWWQDVGILLINLDAATLSVRHQ